MFGRRISRRELERLERRVGELRGVARDLKISDVELLAALLSLEDHRRVQRKVRKQLDPDDEEEDD